MKRQLTITITDKGFDLSISGLTEIELLGAAEFLKLKAKITVIKNIKNNK